MEEAYRLRSLKEQDMHRRPGLDYDRYVERALEERSLAIGNAIASLLGLCWRAAVQVLRMPITAANFVRGRRERRQHPRSKCMA